MPDRGSPCTACGNLTENASQIKVTRHRADDIRKVNYGISQARNKKVTSGRNGVTFVTDNVCDGCVAAVRNYFELVWEARKAGRM